MQKGEQGRELHIHKLISVVDLTMDDDDDDDDEMNEWMIQSE